VVKESFGGRRGRWGEEEIGRCKDLMTCRTARLARPQDLHDLYLFSFPDNNFSDLQKGNKTEEKFKNN
jgi:hypothetical protein